ncbi:MAG: NAD-binding protein, partial [Verrucomicrobia bacterium]|nr:NAD-binding protein [Verrucomicrobiota bacterium]
GGLDYAAALGIDGMICPDYSTAQAIARVLRNPGASAIADFGQDQIEIQEFVVRHDAAAAGTRLADVHMPPGVLLAAINRGGKVFVPDGEAITDPGDKIVLVGNAGTFQSARKLFHKDDNGHLQVVIMGGSPSAVWLCRALRHGNFRIRLFEPELARATFLSNKLDWVTVVQENVIEPSVFEEEKIGQADAFVACCEDDERNILSCVWAKKNGVGKVVAIASRSDYLDLLKSLGIDHAFSPRNEAADEIENFIRSAPLRKLASLADGVVDVYRVPVGRSAKCAGKSIAQLGRPGEWIIAAIRRGDEAFVPRATHTIEAGDILVVVGSHKLERMLSKFFDASLE